jgi:hypothetical protein
MLVATEAAIASNLIHPNIVATYSHDVKTVQAKCKALKQEMQMLKFLLIQVFRVSRNCEQPRDGFKNSIVKQKT